MTKLSGNKKTDMLILMQLTDNDLGAVCQINKYVKSLCDDDMFWFNRIKNVFNELDNKTAQEAKAFLEFDKWKDLYKYLKEYQDKENDEDVSATLSQYISQKENVNELFSVLNWPDWIIKPIFERKLKRENLWIGLYYKTKELFIYDFLKTIYNSSDIEWLSEKNKKQLEIK